MIEIRKIEIFAKWLDGLNDIRARVLARIERLAAGNPGDVAPVGEGFRNCESITVPAIGSTTKNLGNFLSFCWLAGTSELKPRT
jgi:hypothetical protein